MLKYIVALTILLLVSLNTRSQGTDEIAFNHKNSYGVLVNLPINAENLPEGSEYKPYLFQLNFRLPLLKKEGKRQLSLLIQPQFNPVFNIDHQDEFVFEAGVNFGIAYEYLIKPHLIAYGGLGVGPHYINVETSIQAEGFIFSDNFYVGMHQVSGDERWLLTYEVRFRHISNAGLVSPNIGIDNFFVGVGLGYFFQ